MSKKQKVQKSAETVVAEKATLTEQLTARAVSPAVSAAIEFLTTDPKFAVSIQVASKVKEAMHLKQQANELGESVVKKTSVLGDIVIEQNRLNADVLRLKNEIREGILSDPGLAEIRATWEAGFGKWLAQAVDYGALASPQIQDLTTRMEELVKQTEEIRKANSEAEKKAKKNREQAEKLAKEAGKLLASMKMEA